MEGGDERQQRWFVGSLLRELWWCLLAMAINDGVKEREGDEMEMRMNEEFGGSGFGFLVAEPGGKREKV